MLEDLRPHGDVTTQLIKNKKKLKAKIISNQTGIIGGLNFAKEAFKYSDKKINFKIKTKDGRKINKGKIVASITGTAKGILKSERVALNFLSLVSGVATITNKFVTAVKGKSCKICCTRKTIPNLRLMQKYAVKLGGGLNHRFNLSDEYLIKDNHIAASKNIKEIVLKAIKNNKGKKITVEIDKVKQLKEVWGLKFHRVLFDNMSAKNLKLGVKLAKKYYVGTMIELPRAALRAGDIAKFADFFSFGTNDLTQTTFGISRDDSGKFLNDYVENKIFNKDPFISIDERGVGELIKIAVERGRMQKKSLKLGICGEHGGDPSSIEFFARVGLNYVSCSPYRVPVARLAAAQANLTLTKK